MNDAGKKCDMVTDYITGVEVPDMGAEANRQAFERVLVDVKGFSRSEVEVDVPLELVVAGEPYFSRVDLVVGLGGRRMMAVKCAAGSLGSREREILAAARLLEAYQIPLSIVTDGRSAMVLDTVSGEVKGEGIESVPTRDALFGMLKETELIPFPEKRREREKLIFRSYDLENINVRRTNLSDDDSV